MSCAQGVLVGRPPRLGMHLTVVDANHEEERCISPVYHCEASVLNEVGLQSRVSDQFQLRHITSELGQLQAR